MPPCAAASFIYESVPDVRSILLRPLYVGRQADILDSTTRCIVWPVMRLHGMILVLAFHSLRNVATSGRLSWTHVVVGGGKGCCRCKSCMYSKIHV